MFILSFQKNWDSFVKNGLLQSLLSILVVFCVLAFIMFILMIINKINFKNKKETQTNNVVQSPKEPDKVLKIEDIVDDDMMVAVLVATIDYRNQTKTDVRLKNVKQIG